MESQLEFGEPSSIKVGLFIKVPWPSLANQILSSWNYHLGWRALGQKIDKAHPSRRKAAPQRHYPQLLFWRPRYAMVLPLVLQLFLLFYGPLQIFSANLFFFFPPLEIASDSFWYQRNLIHSPVKVSASSFPAFAATLGASGQRRLKKALLQKNLTLQLMPWFSLAL